MVGANYMGGKRNAARARIKDATGKAQRAHFGRKRFEILRTGLSRSGGVVANATRCSLGGPPDIALAHARQDRGAPEAEPVEEYHAGMRSASPRPSTPHRSRWLSSARGSMSRRSNVLRALDGEDAAAQRTQVDEILQVPDLLGLSKAGRKGWQHSLYAEMQVPSTPVRRRTPSIDKVHSSGRPHVPTSYKDTVSSSPVSVEYSEPPSLQLRSHVNTPSSSFIPINLDSSPHPFPNHHDSGYAETWLDIHSPSSPTSNNGLSSYEPPRVRFYSPSVASFRTPSTRTSFTRLANSLSPYSPHTLSRTASLSSLMDGSTCHPNDNLANSLGVGLISPFAHAQFISDVPSPSHDVSPPPPSDFAHPLSPLPDHSSPIFLDDNTAYMDADYDTGYASEDSVLCSALHGVLHSESARHKDDMLEATALADVLGNLFELADPWKSLDKVLDLPRPVNLSNSSLLAELTQDRKGVGHMLAANNLTHTTESSIDNLNASPPLVSNDVFCTTSSAAFKGLSPHKGTGHMEVYNLDDPVSSGSLTETQRRQKVQAFHCSDPLALLSRTTSGSSSCTIQSLSYAGSIRSGGEPVSVLFHHHPPDGLHAVLLPDGEEVMPPDILGGGEMSGNVKNVGSMNTETDDVVLLDGPSLFVDEVPLETDDECE